MSELQLSIRSTRARRLAGKLAKKEQRTVTQIVERALDHYARQGEGGESRSESVAEFYDRMKRDYGGEADVDLDAVIRRGRIDRPGPDL